MSLILRTGYFAKLHEYRKAVLSPVSIARQTPKDVHILVWIRVAPSMQLLSDYKKCYMDAEHFRLHYMAGLEELDVNNCILSDLQQLQKNVEACGLYNGIVFLCYEKPEDFCHRHLLTEYVAAKYGIELQEFEF